MATINGQKVADYFGKAPPFSKVNETSGEMTIKLVRFDPPGTYLVGAVASINGQFVFRTMNYEVVEPATQTAQNVILFIGNSEGLDRTFNGWIDDVYFYKESRSPEQIQALPEVPGP